MYAIRSYYVSVLIAQDLAVVPILLIINAFGKESGGVGDWALVVLKLTLSISFLAFLTVFLSKRKKIDLPFTDWLISKTEILPRITSYNVCYTKLLRLKTA